METGNHLLPIDPQRVAHISAYRPCVWGCKRVLTSSPYEPMASIVLGARLTGKHRASPCAHRVHGTPCGLTSRGPGSWCHCTEGPPQPILPWPLLSTQGGLAGRPGPVGPVCRPLVATDPPWYTLVHRTGGNPLRKPGPNCTPPPPPPGRLCKSGGAGRGRGN